MIVDDEKCTGCRTCEYICSLTKNGTFNPNRSRIQFYRTNCLDLMAKVCIQCEEPDCMEACPFDAIVRIEEGIRVNEEDCTHCGLCMEVCDKIFSDPVAEKAVMCDQCGACVETCPEEALEIR